MFSLIPLVFPFEPMSIIMTFPRNWIIHIFRNPNHPKEQKLIKKWVELAMSNDSKIWYNWIRSPYGIFYHLFYSILFYSVYYDNGIVCIVEMKYKSLNPTQTLATTQPKVPKMVYACSSIAVPIQCLLTNKQTKNARHLIQSSPFLDSILNELSITY